MSVGAVNKNTGERIPTAGMPSIDDALDLTSVNPVQNAIITAALADKQDKTDNSLQTTDKTVVGAINEHEGDISSLMSGLTNLITSYVINSGESVDINSTSFILIAKRTSNVSGQSVNAMYFTNEELFNTGDNQNPLTFTRIGNVFTVTNNNASAINLIVFLCSFVS